VIVSGAFVGKLLFRGGHCGSPGTANGTVSWDSWTWVLIFGEGGGLYWDTQSSPYYTFEGIPVWSVSGSGATRRIDFDGTLRDPSGKQVQMSGGGLCSELGLL
jgi:hypothetical protein